MSHIHIHLHDARRRRKRRRDAAPFEAAKHPRGKGGHFMPGGGEHVEPESERSQIGRGHAMPVTTGALPKRHDCTCK